jgi:hypothetical protein
MARRVAFYVLHRFSKKEHLGARTSTQVPGVGDIKTISLEQPAALIPDRVSLAVFCDGHLLDGCGEFLSLPREDAELPLCVIVGEREKLHWRPHAHHFGCLLNRSVDVGVREFKDFFSSSYSCVSKDWLPPRRQPSSFLSFLSPVPRSLPRHREAHL